MKIIAIIQARMGSTRLPGKVLKPILSKPMLWHVIQRVKKAKLIDQIIVATTKQKQDQKIVKFCQENKIKVFTGSENNVLERYYLAAKKFQADIIVRITADCPLVDPAVIDKAIKKYLDGGFDHLGVATGAGVAKQKIKRFPDGLDCEVFTFKALEEANREAKDPMEREHVTVFIWRRPERFKLGGLENDKDYSFLRFTVDHPSDLKFVRTVYKNLYPKKRFFLLNDIVDLIKNNLDVLKINQQNIGKEGYEKLYEK